MTKRTKDTGLDTDKIKARVNLYEDRIADAIIGCFELPDLVAIRNEFDTRDKVRLVVHMIEYLRSILFQNNQLTAEILVKLGLEDFDNVFKCDFKGVH